MVEAYPLCWPEGWKRTKRAERRNAKFGRSVQVEGRSWKSKQDLTVTQALSRVLEQLERMGIDRQEVVISTNIRTRLDGMPRSGEREPEDRGAAVYWRERGKPLDDPLGTIVTKANMCLAEPYLTKYFGTAMANSVDEPLDTITTKDRFGLVQPEWNGYRLDIRFRMLQPHELAAAQGFPADYKFQGNKSEIVKQIGNAVPCGLAKALIGSLLEGYRSKAKPELVRKAVSA